MECRFDFTQIHFLRLCSLHLTAQYFYRPLNIKTKFYADREQTSSIRSFAQIGGGKFGSVSHFSCKNWEHSQAIGEYTIRMTPVKSDPRSHLKNHPDERKAQPTSRELDSLRLPCVLLTTPQVRYTLVRVILQTSVTENIIVSDILTLQLGSAQ